jgi:hypothetical protein
MTGRLLGKPDKISGDDYNGADRYDKLALLGLICLNYW